MCAEEFLAKVTLLPCISRYLRAVNDGTDDLMGPFQFGIIYDSIINAQNWFGDWPSVTGLLLWGEAVSRSTYFKVN